MTNFPHQGLVMEIARRISDYLDEKERELQERVKAGVEIDYGWNGYEITIAGHRITAEHDSSTHRWRFRYLERDYEEFFNISEKKGQAIVDFLKALSRAINPSVAAADQDEDFLGDSSPDPAVLNEENFGSDKGWDAGPGEESHPPRALQGGGYVQKIR